jgi:SnoaL-like protein
VVRGERTAEILKQEVRDTTEIEVSPRNLEAFVEGSVGWVSGWVVWILGDGREVPTRWTAVFHREGDDWKMVQAHTSVGVPNEELFGGWPSKVVGRSRSPSAQKNAR